MICSIVLVHNYYSFQDIPDHDLYDIADSQTQINRLQMALIAERFGRAADRFEYKRRIEEVCDKHTIYIYIFFYFKLEEKLEQQQKINKLLSVCKQTPLRFIS